MNCEELQCDLPDIMEGSHTTEQAAHLQSCLMCSGLLADLQVISREARQLRASDDPSPRVWNSIEIALRQEGLIHPPRRGPAAVFPRWAPVWLVPIAATFLVALTVARYELKPYGQSTIAQTASAPMVTSNMDLDSAATADDRQMLEVVGTRSPALRASYAADLRRVNAYIRDAEASAHSNPNDEEAQRYLMDAHEEKAMMYQMALNSSLQ
jgi:hypothetical protein